MKMYEFEFMGRKAYCIAKEELINGEYYRGKSRNAELHLARWKAEIQKFVYVREKFGSLYIEAIYHPEDEPYRDTFRAQSVAENPEFEIPLDNTPLDGDKINAACKAYYIERMKQFAKER